MFCKIKSVATVCLEKAEPKEIEPKSIKLRVASGTKVRKFVAKAFKNAGLDDALVECVDIQYSSKKFGGKFLSVAFDQQVKDGREYKIWVREAVPLIKEEEIKLAQKVAAIAVETDLFTCKDYDEIEASNSIGVADVFAENFEKSNVCPVTYVGIVTTAESKDGVVTPQEVDSIKVENGSVFQSPIEHVIVSVESDQDSDKVVTSVEPSVKETEVVSGKPPSTPSSFKKFWPWFSSPATADGSPIN